MRHKLDFKKAIRLLEEKKSTLPNQLAHIAQSAFINNFRTSSWFGNKWPEVQRRLKPAPKSDPKANSRGILRGKTRRLLHDVEHSIREANWREIRLGVSVPYAEYHNDGTDKIPKRRFMGDHPKLRAKLRKKMDTELKTIFK